MQGLLPWVYRPSTSGSYGNLWAHLKSMNILEYIKICELVSIYTWRDGLQRDIHISLDSQKCCFHGKTKI